MRLVKDPIIAATIAAIFSLLPLPHQASASDLNRAEYVAAAEPICKRAVEANLGIFKGIRAANLKKAAKRFSRAAASFRKRLRELEAVPQPTADEPRLAKWLEALGVETELLADLGSSLKAEEKARAKHYAERLRQNANHANNLVLGFGFAYCTLDPGRFL